MISFMSRWKSHSRQFRLMARWGRWQKMQLGSVAWAIGHRSTEFLLSPQWLHLGLLRQHFEVCSKRKQLLHWSGERILGDTSKMILKIEIVCGILVDRNFSSTIRVDVGLSSLLMTVRLKAIMGTSLTAPSQKSSSGKEMSSLIIPWE